MVNRLCFVILQEPKHKDKLCFYHATTAKIAAFARAGYAAQLASLFKTKIQLLNKTLLKGFDSLLGYKVLGPTLIECIGQPELTIEIVLSLQELGHTELCTLEIRDFVKLVQTWIGRGLTADIIDIALGFGNDALAFIKFVHERIEGKTIDHSQHAQISS